MTNKIKGDLESIVEHTNISNLLQTLRPFAKLSKYCYSEAAKRGFWDQHQPDLKNAISTLVRIVDRKDFPTHQEGEREALEMLDNLGYVIPLGGRYIATSEGTAVAEFAKSIDLDGACTRSPAEGIALMHSELSEMLEAYRDGDPRSEKIGDNFSQVEEELADLIIRALDFAGGFGLNLDGAIAAKLERNAKRPYKHGKSF